MTKNPAGVVEGDRLREGGLDGAGRDHEDEAAAPRAAVASGARHLSRTACHDRAGRVCISGRGFVPSPDEQQHPECGTTSAGQRQGRDQRVGLPGDRLDAAQRDGAVESGRDRAAARPHGGERRRRAYMHAAEFWNERVEMMQVWADYLDQLRHGSSVDEGVRPFLVSQG